jgi:hypothetical protein
VIILVCQVTSVNVRKSRGNITSNPPSERNRYRTVKLIVRSTRLDSNQNGMSLEGKQCNSPMVEARLQFEWTDGTSDIHQNPEQYHKRHDRHGRQSDNRFKNDEMRMYEKPEYHPRQHELVGFDSPVFFESPIVRDLAEPSATGVDDCDDTTETHAG